MLNFIGQPGSIHTIWNLYFFVKCISFLISDWFDNDLKQSKVFKEIKKTVGGQKLHHVDTNEPRHEKTNVLVSDLVRHKPCYTATKDS